MEAVVAPVGVVDQLIRDRKGPGTEARGDAADGGQPDHTRCPGGVQCPEVGPIIDAVGWQPVALPMAGEEENRPTREPTLHQGRGDRAEGCLRGLRPADFESLQTLKSRTADDRKKTHGTSPNLIGEQSNPGAMESKKTALSPG